MDYQEDDGLPDAAFTEDELAAGVQHIMRTGDPDATASRGRMHLLSAREPADVDDDDSAETLDDFLRFDTFSQARSWAQANPGRSFSRAADGRGFTPQPVRSKPRERIERATLSERIEISKARESEIKAMVPHLHEVLYTCGWGARNKIIMRPFSRTLWETELSRLSPAQIRRLRSLITVNIEEYRAMLRRFVGDVLYERLIEVMEVALADIGRRVPS